MEFKAGNKVRVKSKILSNFSPNLAKKFNSQGVVIATGARYTYVKFVNGVKYWFINKALELTKNQQLEFAFMA